MATLERDGINEDQLVGKQSAFCATMARLERPETPILSYFSPNLQNLRTPNGMVPFGQRSYKYKERVHLHGRTTLASDVAASAVSITLVDKVCRPGDLIVIGDEVITLVSSADYLTFVCTKSTFTGADAAHSSGDAVFVFGTSYAESANAPTASAIPQATEVTTYTDIIMESAKISGSAEEVEQYAEDPDKLFEYSYELMLQAKHQLQARLMWSDATAPAGDTTAGRMDGIYERVVGSSYVDFSSGDITYANLQLMIRKVTRKGARGPFALFVSDYQGHQMDTWMQAYAQVQPSDLAAAVFGSHVKAIRVGQHVIDIIATDEMDKNCLLASRDNIRVGPKSPKRQFHVELLGKKGDYTELMLVGEYTCEVALAYSHCWGKDVKLAA